MITLELIRTVLDSQKKTFPIRLVQRDLIVPESKHRAIILSGIRRCGKSTLLRNDQQGPETLFINFEDPRLEGFSNQDFYKLESIAEASGQSIFVFDEIQNIPGWERYVNAAIEQGKSIYITGSNASMLSKELGTKLTGRYQQLELFPFGYQEYLDAVDSLPSSESFTNFLTDGGFPEYLIFKEADYLRTLFSDIILRDIVVRRNIRNEKTLMQMAIFLMSNTGKLFSYNKLSSLLEIKSVRTTIDYLNYLKEAYLFETVSLYTPSIRKQISNAKKIYAIDTGMARANSISMSPDLGRMLETIVFQFLRKNNRQIYYYTQDRSECDFLVKSETGELKAVQVCAKLTEKNLNLELLGLKNAVENTEASEGMILTLDQEDELDGFPVIPCWKWMS